MLIQKLLYKIKDFFLWKYNCYWEQENTEDYLNGSYESEMTFIVEQRIAIASEIEMNDNAITKSDFPWHGYSFDDFEKLNQELQCCIKEIYSFNSPNDIKHFRRKHRKVYDAYFCLPICVSLNDTGKLCFGFDGRHRIYFASVCNGVIPVWVIEEKKVKDVDLEYYKKHLYSGEWRFLNEI